MIVTGIVTVTMIVTVILTGIVTVTMIVTVAVTVILTGIVTMIVTVTVVTVPVTDVGDVASYCVTWMMSPLCHVPVVAYPAGCVASRTMSYVLPLTSVTDEMSDDGA